MKKQRSSMKLNDNLNESFRMKTEKAIELINRHEQNKYNFLKTLKQNKEYLKYLPMKQDQFRQNFVEIKQIYEHKNHKIQLMPFDDLIYKLLNPFCSHIKEKLNDKSQIKIVREQQQGYGLSKKQNITETNLNYSFRKTIIKHEKQLIDRKIKLLIKNFRGSSATQLFLYFQSNDQTQKFNIPYKRYTINSQRIIHINLDDFTTKRWIYLRFKTKQQLTLFIIRVQSEHSQKKRFITDMSESNQKQKISQKIKILPQLKSTIELKSLKSFTIQKYSTKNCSKLRSQSLKALSSLQLIQSTQSPSSKSKNKQILGKLKKQEMIKKKQQQDKKLSDVVAKKNAVELARQIELKLKRKALQMKRLIEEYKVIHQEQQNKIKYMQPKIAALIFLPQFNKICHQMIMQRQKGIKEAWKTLALTKKFVRNLKRQNKQSIQEVKNKKTRQLLKIRDFTTLFGKVLYKNSIKKSSNILVSTVQKCKTGLILNQVFDSATQYRRSIRCIQKAWLSQYNARMTMFQTYIKNQVQLLIKKYPYFKYAHSKFLLQNVTHHLAYKYLSQQSSKINDLFEQYKQKLKQIQQFKEMNKKIAQFNKTALKKRQKPYLQVPRKPCYPTTRYFRNVTFLKSMIRGWFELEYRKWSKVNKFSIGLVSETEKRSVSPEKSFSKASINSVQLSPSGKNKI